MRVFIGSSGEAIRDLELLAAWVEECGHEPVPWNSAGVFAAGGNTLASLADVAKGVDAALFVFSEDDEVQVRNSRMKQPRDNVLIEYGLFWGILGARRVVFCRKGQPKPASDLAARGETHFPVDGRGRTR